ncbi:Late embryogenesis abundant protein, LEA_2 subgroup [Dillenia turbinata]|uniref:Late embryogenesis abundant protein, LEA_2 subgroup n=1 Tax=Dillenia turbinata TaxID=194707 RepID=A0AAN8V3B7_9MAGN
MAYPPPQPAKPHHKLLRWIAIAILALIVIVGLAVLIIWLTIKPKRLVYSVEEVLIQNFNLTNNHLNATFDIVMTAYNPNTKVSFYYDSVEVTVTYHDQTVAFTGVEPFFQSHQNVTRLEVKPVAQYLPLKGSVAMDLGHEKSSGEVKLAVYVKARIRFKVGVWKSKDRTLRVACDRVSAHFYSAKRFEMTFCDVDL